MSGEPPHLSPYPGLRPFESHEADLFFGRAEQINQMLDKLESHRFIAVVGASGSGKSSLVRAGLLPALEEGMLSNAQGTWNMVIMRPGELPFANLAQAISEAFRLEQSAVESSVTEAALREGESGLVEIIKQLRGASVGGNSLVLIDQFEEIFRFRQLQRKATSRMEFTKADYFSRSEASTFVQLVQHTVRQNEIPIHVVITMRSEFIGDCDAFPGFPELVSGSQFLAPRLTREQMQEAIEGPLRHPQFKAAASKELVNTILNEAGEGLDQLPLVQHALMRTYLVCRNEGSNTLTNVHYNQAGGIERALHHHAEEAWGELDVEGKKIAEKLFRALSERTRLSPLTRRLSSIQEVAGIAVTQASRVAGVVEVFCSPLRSFIVVSPKQSRGPEAVLDVTHEALLRNWERIGEWIEAESASATLFAYLQEFAGKGWRMPSPLLAQAVDWLHTEIPTSVWAERYADKSAAVGFEGVVSYVQGFISPTVPAGGRPPGRSESHERQYWCFFSYRHSDNRGEGRQWANWLHQQIETYEVPADLIGKKNERGEVIPSRIFPVFRDEMELGSSADLRSKITNALDNSRVLIVLCSPGAMQSVYVTEEILRFKGNAAIRPIIPVILSGDPSAPLSDPSACLPDALGYRVEVGGGLERTESEWLWADLRLPDGGEGFTTVEAYHYFLARNNEFSRIDIQKALKAYEAKLQSEKLKIMAGILGIPVDMLRKRDRAYQLQLARKRSRILTLLLACLSLVFVFFLYVLVYGWKGLVSTG